MLGLLAHPRRQSKSYTAMSALISHTEMTPWGFLG